MKRIIISLVLFLCISISYAQNFNSKQEALRKEISAFLSKHSFTPEKQNDGLKFKSEGANYYIEIDKDCTAPMYLRLCRYVKYDNNLSRDAALPKLNSFNSSYGIKVACQENSLVLSAEMFLTKSEEFEYSFDALFSQLKSVYRKITE